MSKFRKVVEAHPVPWFFGALISAFLAGVGSYRAIITWSGQKVVHDEALLKLAVRVEPIPRDASVELGNSAGKFFQGMPLPDGSSEFNVTREGYRPQTIRLARVGGTLVFSVPMTRFPRLSASSQRQYVGEKLNMNMKGADVRDVFRSIAQLSSQNLVIAKEVEGKITFHLEDVPWDQAVDLIALQAGLAVEVKGNVIYVDAL